MSWRSRIGSVGALLLLLICRPASAVIVAGDFSSESDANVNTTADSVPSGFPYWGNVGRLASASAIYIGDDWVLTASHISGYNTATTTFTFNDPTSGSPITVGYQSVPTSVVHLTNPDQPASGQSSDLVMFQIDPTTGVNAGTQASYSQAPNLRNVVIENTPQVATNSVLAIGRGIDRQPSVTNWNNSWTETTSGVHSGYKWDANNTQTMRWGDNLVSSSSDSFLTVPAGQVLAFTTTFDKNGTANEFQATTGDSGGGVFQFDPAVQKWELAGMMEATGAQFSTQPTATSVFGDTTYIADLSYYRSQILNLAPIPGDVNGDGRVDIQDLTLIANNWLTHGPAGDANHDGIVDIQDLTLAANYWTPSGGVTSDSLGLGGATVVPEPSTYVLAGWGLLGILLGRSVIARRQYFNLRRQQPLGRAPVS